MSRFTITNINKQTDTPVLIFNFCKKMCPILNFYFYLFEALLVQLFVTHVYFNFIYSYFQLVIIRFPCLLIICHAHILISFIYTSNLFVRSILPLVWNFIYSVVCHTRILISFIYTKSMSFQLVTVCFIYTLNCLLVTSAHILILFITFTRGFHFIYYSRRYEDITSINVSENENHENTQVKQIKISRRAKLLRSS